MRGTLWFRRSGYITDFPPKSLVAGAEVEVNGVLVRVKSVGWWFNRDTQYADVQLLHGPHVFAVPISLPGSAV
jgi:hypothetical protein